MKKQDAATKLETLESLFSAESVGPTGDESDVTRSPRRTVTEIAVTEGLRRAQIDHIAAIYESEIKLRDEVEALKLALKGKNEQAEKDRLLIEELGAKNADLAAKEETDRGQMARLEKQNRELKGSEDECKASIAGLEEKIGELRTQVATEGRLRIDAIKRIQEESNRKLAQISDEKWELELQLEELRKAQVEAEARVQQMRAETDNYAQNYHIAVNEISELRIELANKDGELAQMRQKFDYELKIRDARMPQGNLADVLRDARQEFHQELSALKADSQQTIHALKNEQARLETELLKARESAAEYKRENLSLQVEMEKARLDDERARAAKESETERALKARDVKILDLEATHASLERECKKAVDAEASLRQQIVETENRLKIIEEQARSGALAKQNEFQRAVSAKELRIQELKGLCDSVERDRSRLAESEQRLRAENEKLESRYRAMEDASRADLIRYQNECSTVSVQLAVAREQMTALKEERGELVAELESTNRAVSELREALIGRAGDVQAAKESAACEINDYRKRAESVEGQLFEARGKIQQLENRLEFLQRGVAEGEQRAQALMRDAEHGARLELRENQLRVYSSALSKEKSEMQKIAKNLVKEIRMLSATHPLRDYVAATEFELSKIEIQLKKTPTVSAERAQYEDYLTKLVEQRDFLKGVLGSSQRQYETQVSELERLVSGSLLSPVPPPPPTKTAPGKAVALNSVTSSIGTDVPVQPGRGENRLEPRWEKPFDIIT